MGRSPLADADGWINPRRSKCLIQVGSRGRSRKSALGDEGPSCNPRHPLPIGEPAGSVGDTTPTAMTSRSGGLTGGVAGDEDDATSEDFEFPPQMSDEDFKKIFVVSEANKAMWEDCVAEADREVRRLFGDDCS